MDNSASSSGGGAGVNGSSSNGWASTTLNNCIVYFNTAPAGANYGHNSLLTKSCTTPLPTNGVGNLTNQPAFQNAAAGDYHLGYGSPCIDAGINLGALITSDLDGRPRPLDGDGDGVAAFDMGAYEHRALFVSSNSPAPTTPYASWATAAHTIQEAVDAAQPTDTVLVTNGVYATGGRAVVGTMTNRVAIEKAITVESLMGPEVTVIAGWQVPGITNGDGAIRCVYLADGAVLSGFTLTNGATRNSGDSYRERSGGGVWAASLNTIVSNCVLIGNSASRYGGGASSSTLSHCTLSMNSAFDGGGAESAILNNCIVNGNRALAGGGVALSSLTNCTLTGNRALGTGGGGGADESTLRSCTLVGNEADNGNGGGASESDLDNCIVYYNTALRGSNYDSDSTLDFSCTTPPPTEGTANITNAPAFLNAAAGDFRLAYGSPCIDAGTNLSFLTTSDLDGNPRPLDGNGDGFAAFDMGAYEFDLRSVVPEDWFTRYGLDPTDPDIVSGNPDNDFQTTFQEWQADTDPTNGQSYFRIDHIEVALNGTPASVYFQTSSNRHYTLFCAADLEGASTDWMSLPEQTAVQGSGGMDSLTDTNAAEHKFYKVGVDAQPYYLKNMAWIPSGTFTMGSPETEAQRDGDEFQHEVTISRGFWIKKYEVTQGEYLEVVGSNPSHWRNGTPPFGDGIGGLVTNELQHPVEQVTWIDATNYCALLTERERAAGRLPDGITCIAYPPRPNGSMPVGRGQLPPIIMGMSCVRDGRVLMGDPNMTLSLEPLAIQKGCILDGRPR